ncbi:succinylglutamate desuccinylase/aspartoacylase family protein [Gracilimonas tropica]|uniref:succinylglutamate desuccinylase/aspartoacylase family protein n=1 Tax=Gracilimonas tropica TaxID=454600 RepID=UPI001FE0F86A|nr:succinylglutamate desuccinylase/aspartoacylase family protein [Gracilimonas tropica]
MEKLEEKKQLIDYSDRIIGDIQGDYPGPTIIAMAGIHGNEPSGIEATKHILKKIKDNKTSLHGRFLGLIGNIQALQEGKRFIDEDMNRIWFTSILDKIRRTPIAEILTAERRETKKVLEIVDPILESAGNENPVIFLDMHTFSAEDGLFVISTRDERNITLLAQLSVPLIFGIEKALHGTALKYFQNTGNIGFAFETGQHFSASARKNATAGLMCLLVASGVISASDIDDFPRYYDYLNAQTEALPHKVEFLYKHIIEPGDEFEMRPGFKNFDKVKKGQWLATDRHGKILAQRSGFVLMPLYQDQGEDGFFIVEECD